MPPGLRDGRRAMGLVLVTVLATSLPHPWGLIALATGVAALVFGLRAVAAQVRDRRWGWAAWHLVAVTFAGYLVGFGALRAAYPEPFDAWSACSRGANTRIAQAGCDAALATRTPPWLARALGVS
ncbi:hypothetical protein ADJ73_16405 [Arsenicicoccus sp. oral taxon 190]|nr:hypothetical protein ADJ73_16405 [Arsenicicoccus sp. oral taxon 190]